MSEIGSNPSRSQSSRSTNDFTDEETSPHSIPPWETRTVPQVPYVKQYSTPPTMRKESPTHARQRSDRSDSLSKAKPKLVTANSAPSKSEYTSPVTHDAVPMPWEGRRYTIPVPPSKQPAPYETPIDVPYEMKVPKRLDLTSHPPPSPPEISPYSSTKSASPPPREPPVQSLPGTMSSRMSRPEHTLRSRSKAKSYEDHLCGRSEHRPLSKRFASAFREMFKRDPVDESELERISDRHWTDEA